MRKNGAGKTEGASTSQTYTQKAEAYHRYRWDYAPDAIQTIVDITGIAENATIADIGREPEF